MSANEDGVLRAEWVHLVDVEEASEGDIVHVEAPQEVLDLLPRRLEVGTIKSLSADVKLSRPPGDLVVHVSGTMKACVEQICVLSAEPIENTIEEEVEGWFSDPEQAVSFIKEKRNKLYEGGHGEAPILEESDDPEAIVDGKIDLGEFIVQHLSLAIDAYPRAQGAEYENGDEKTQGEPSSLRKNPFAALKDWKHKQENE